MWKKVASPDPQLGYLTVMCTLLPRLSIRPGKTCLSFLAFLEAWSWGRTFSGLRGDVLRRQ